MCWDFGDLYNASFSATQGLPWVQEQGTDICTTFWRQKHFWDTKCKILSRVICASCFNHTVNCNTLVYESLSYHQHPSEMFTRVISLKWSIMLPFTRTCTREGKYSNRWLDGAGDKCPSLMKVKRLNAMERAGGGHGKSGCILLRLLYVNFSALSRRYITCKEQELMDLQEEDPKIKKKLFNIRYLRHRKIKYSVISPGK